MTRRCPCSDNDRRRVFYDGCSRKFGSSSFPSGFTQIEFAVVPFFDLIVFAVLFSGAIYYRKRPAEHKRLMLLTVVNFLPPALGRFPIASVQSLGPIFFVAVPCVIAIGLVIYDAWRNRKLNVVFLVGALIFVTSNPLRIMISTTDTWARFATWLTTWAA